MTELSDYHWTPQLQRRFIEALAESGSITRACAAVGKSRMAAYGLRHRNDGAAFNLGWAAAILMARAQLSDDLVERAIWGQEDVVIRSTDGTLISTSRRRHDNRLGMSTLSRLDSMAKRENFDDIDAVLARLVASDFELFLDLIEAGGGAAEMAAFVADRSDLLGVYAPAGLPGNGQCKVEGHDAMENEAQSEEIPYLDRDPEENAAKMSVWYNEADDCWRTNFPPPSDFIGEEDGEFGEDGYQRQLSDAEEHMQRAFMFEGVEPLHEAAVRAWARYFDRPVTAFFGGNDGNGGAGGAPLAEAT
jgi:hypothetical protein